MPSGPEVDRLLAAALRAADPTTAARMVAEAFLAASRTADPATLSFMVQRLTALRADPTEPQIEFLFQTVAGVVGVRTRQPHATRHLDEALRIFAAHRLHTDALYVECAIMATLTLIRPHEVRPTYAHLVADLDLDPDRQARLTAMIALGDAWAGDLRRGCAGLLEARQLAHDADRPDIQAEVTSWLVKIEALCGDLTASAAHLAETRELAARAGSSWVASQLAECTAALHLVTGNTEAWVGVLQLLVNTTVGVNSGLIFEHRWELATHHALRGDHDLAQALLAGTPDPPLAWPGAPAMPAWRAWITQPTDPQTMARFEASLDGLNRPAERISRPRMAWLLGTQHARLGNRADATRLLEAACAGYAAIGAAGPLALVMATLQDVTPQPVAMPTEAPDPRRHGKQPLTRTEVQVALAVAEGRSNREVAEQLSVTARTIEFHLGNIYRKLSIRNRTELANRRGQLGWHRDQF